MNLIFQLRLTKADQEELPVGGRTESGREPLGPTSAGLFPSGSGAVSEHHHRVRAGNSGVKKSPRIRARRTGRTGSPGDPQAMPAVTPEDAADDLNSTGQTSGRQLEPPR